MIGIESRLPEDFLVATISTIISFDNNKEQNEKNLASEYCEYVAQFIWAAMELKITPITTLADADDLELQNWFVNRHKKLFTGKWT